LFDAKETKKLVEKGQEFLTLPFHFTKISNVENVVKKHLEKSGKLDILVNNASRQLVCKNFADIDLGNFNNRDQF